MLEDIAEDIDGDAAAGDGDIDPVDGAVEGRVGVHVAAGGLDLLVDAAGAAGGGALEQHVFEHVGQPGADPIALIDTAGAAPRLGADDRGAVVFANNQLQAVLKSMDRDTRGGRGVVFRGSVDLRMQDGIVHEAGRQ